ncbi:hypothetical protein D5W64_13045 [Salmonella enterica subsp. enterica serovar Saintpaul]|nr:hypothetical protein [Salmonella enterica subsp. enterica serovar Saintpaul]
MLGIDFLNHERPITVAGQEFMDYQNKNMYKDLVALVDKSLEDVSNEHVSEAHNIRGDKETLTKISQFIFANTGINLIVLPPQDAIGNMAVDAAYIKPGHIFNSKYVEQILSVNDSSIGRAFHKVKTDVLKGWVDTSKARVGGDFSKIDFHLHLGPYVESFISTKFLKRYNVSLAEALATVILHECGHIFTGLLMMTNTVIDGIMPSLATKMIIDGNYYGKQRIAVVYETLKELGVTERPDADVIESADANALIVMFNKCIANRDIRRTLSIGATDRGSEVYADLFAVRAGCPKAYVAAVATISDLSILGSIAMGAYAVGIALSFITFPLGLFGYAVSALFTLFRLQNVLNPSAEYDSQYRRLKNILRDQIMHLNDADWMDKASKAVMLKEAKELEGMVEENKPMLEGTIIQRYVGWVFSGADFKAQQFEHYTDELLAHNLSLYKNYL